MQTMIQKAAERPSERPAGRSLAGLDPSFLQEEQAGNIYVAKYVGGRKQSSWYHRNLDSLPGTITYVATASPANHNAPRAPHRLSCMT